jgi:hypothetical protein
VGASPTKEAPVSELDTTLQDEEIRGETTWEESSEEGDSDGTDSGDSDGTDSGDSDGMDSGDDSDSDGSDSDSDGSDS